MKGRSRWTSLQTQGNATGSKKCIMVVSLPKYVGSKNYRTRQRFILFVRKIISIKSLVLASNKVQIFRVSAKFTYLHNIVLSSARQSDRKNHSLHYLSHSCITTLQWSNHAVT